MAVTTCRECRAEVQVGRNFCFNCGAPLALTCARCGLAHDPGHRFCGGCGEPLGAGSRPLPGAMLATRAALEGERKQVTILFADLKDSMEVLAGRDPEEARKILDPALALMMEAVREHGGTVNQVMGDGIMALFGAPVALEDHAVRACHAALAMQASLRRYAAELARRGDATLLARAGLNAGEVVVRAIGSGLAMDYTAVGESTHLAGRMEQMARPGSIYVTAHVARLAEGHIDALPLGEMAIKGLAEPIAVYELRGLTGARSRLEIALARGLTRFSGRDAEMAALARAAEQARAGRGQVVGIVGEPGVGKSRLTWELLASRPLDGFTVLRGNAASYAKASPYLPVIELLRAALDLAPGDDAERVRARLAGALTPEESERFAAPVSSLLGLDVDDARWATLDSGQRRRRTIDAAKYLITRRSADAPLCLLVEDAHLLDDETEAVLDALVDGAALARMLILVTYRPEWQHGWANKAYYTHVRVNPLPPDSAERLAGALLGDSPDLAPVRRQLVERAEGNPLFLEESVRYLVDHRVLDGERGAHRLGHVPEGAPIPETVHAVLAARIDRLAPGDKDVLQAAAAIGAHVPRSLLEGAVGGAPGDLRASVGRLQQREFLHEVQLDPEVTYAFTHALTQEVAYAGLVRDRRRGLHGRIVDAIEGGAGAHAADRVEQLAHHSVRAELWDRALRYGREAGARAFTRSAHRGAAAYFRQALAALEHLPAAQETTEQAVDLRLDLRHALSPLGEYRQMFEALTEAERLASSIGDQRRHGAIASFLCNALTLRGDFARAIEHGERATRIAASLGDRALEGVASATLMLAHYGAGHYRRAIAAGAGAIALDDLSHRSPFGITVPPAIYGRSVAAWALAELGDLDQGRRLAREALARAEALAHPHSAIFAAIGAGTVALRAGEAAEALAVLERALDVWRTADLPAVLVELAGPLASAYVANGRGDDALALLDEAVAQAVALQYRFGHVLRTGGVAEAYLAVGRADDARPLAQLHVEIVKMGQMRGREGWAHHLLAQIEAARPEPDAGAAERALEAALAIADELEMRPLAAHVWLTRASLARAGGRDEDARRAAGLARERFRALGIASRSADADALLASLRSR